MGDRVSISFSLPRGDMGERETSPAFFSHWGGMDIVNDAYAYIRDLKKENAGKSCNPLERLEPGTVMVDFIRYITARKVAYQQSHPKQKEYYPRPHRILSDYYLGRDDSCGDNSDNGHHDIKMDEVD